MAMARLALINAGCELESYARIQPRLFPLEIRFVADSNDKGLEDIPTAMTNVQSISIDELFNAQHEQFDAVVVHASGSQRRLLVERAANAGKHIFLEGPIATTLEEADAIVDLCKQANVVLMVGQPYRFSPDVQTIATVLNDRKIGNPGLLRVHRWSDAKRMPNGSDISFFANEVDLACWLFGESPNAIYAKGQESECATNSVYVHLGFPNGGMALIDCSNQLPENSPSYSAVSLIGSSGAAYADDHHNSNLIFQGGNSIAANVSSIDEQLHLQLCDFARAIENGSSTLCYDEAAARKAIEVSLRVQAQFASTSSQESTVEYRNNVRSKIESVTTVTTRNEPLGVAVLSVVKHCYLPRGIFSHPRFVPKVVADDPDQPDWVHERNEKFAAEFGIPYVRDVERAVRDYGANIAVVSSEAERHCDLSIRAAHAGLHVVQDKPMSTRLSECDRLVNAVEANDVRFLLWNRNFLPAILQAHNVVASGKIGDILAIHVDFYFAKDAGPAIGSRPKSDPPLDWLEYLKAAHATGADGGVGKDPMGELEVEGIYPLAYIHMLTGCHTKRVFARTTSHFHQLHHDNNVDDLATVSLEMENGIHGTLCIGRIGNASHPDIGEIKVHIVGTKGSLVTSEARPEVAVYYRGQPESEFPHVRIANNNDWLLANDFAHAIDTGSDTILNAQVGRAICATVQAAMESGKTGAVVSVHSNPSEK